jgi:hypothetical protein
MGSYKPIDVGILLYMPKLTFHSIWNYNMRISKDFLASEFPAMDDAKSGESHAISLQ